MASQKIPRDIYPDISIPLLFDPYRGISKRAARNGSDIFRTRMMLRPTVCMVGEDAARLFYDEERFQRAGAAPLWLQKTLFGVGGIQAVDDEEHKRRKRMFMTTMTPVSLATIGEIADSYWEEALEGWIQSDSVTLYREVQTILTRAVCDWAGVPLAPDEVEYRREELAALFDKAGGMGHFKARRARARAERWIQGLVEDLRSGRYEGANDTPLATVSFYRDVRGELLPSKVAAVEVLNLLRPTVAVSVYITFAAHALQQYPECAEKVRTVGEEYEEIFVQEVRRFYPFFPSLIAKVRKDFEWKGYHFKRGWTAVLDIYGTNHDPRSWERPGEFWPERFREGEQSMYNFIPQGGGEHLHTHRCVGEFLTTDFMKRAVRFLTTRMRYELPEQDLSIAMNRLPALPRSHFIMSEIRPSASEGTVLGKRGSIDPHLHH